MRTKVIGFVDPDVASSLDLITARGGFPEGGRVREITRECSFRNLEAQGIKKKVVQKGQMLLSL